MGRSGKRYGSGRKENSFFVDMPVAKKKRGCRHAAPGNVFGYTYYADREGCLVREKM